MSTTTETFLKVLDPEDTSTGGGSASAIAGSMAGALLSMCCLLSTSQPDKNGETLRETAGLARELSSRLLAGGTEDSQAFLAVRSAYQLPKDSEAEKETRRQAVQSAWLEAARIPLDNAARCLQVAQWAVTLAEQINPRVRSDLTCCVLLAHAGVLGCLENVAVNLPSLKDPDIVSQFEKRAASLQAQLQALKIDDLFSNPSLPA
jgi:formiminotetrahydrofolate cyclodeaminase